MFGMSSRKHRRREQSPTEPRLWRDAPPRATDEAAATPRLRDTSQQPGAAKDARPQLRDASPPPDASENVMASRLRAGPRRMSASPVAMPGEPRLPRDRAARSLAATPRRRDEEPLPEPRLQRAPRSAPERSEARLAAPTDFAAPDDLRPYHRDDRKGPRRPAALWIIAASLAVIAVALGGIAVRTIYAPATPTATASASTSASRPSGSDDILPALAKAPPIAPNSSAVPAPRKAPHETARTDNVAKPHEVAKVAKAHEVAKAPEAIEPQTVTTMPGAQPTPVPKLANRRIIAPPPERKLAARFEKPAAKPQPIVTAPRDLAGAAAPKTSADTASRNLSGYNYVGPGDALVKVGNTTYVAGREPHSLGTIAVPVGSDGN